MEAARTVCHWRFPNGVPGGGLLRVLQLQGKE
jgi:hypothetical protein